MKAKSPEATLSNPIFSTRFGKKSSRRKIIGIIHRHKLTGRKTIQSAGRTVVGADGKWRTVEGNIRNLTLLNNGKNHSLRVTFLF